MASNKPNMLHKWQGETPVDFKALPDSIKKKIKRKKNG
jgi:hypothetical protein